ncbi:hypothetical protein APR41_07890 [Salegentibacter salinarum]|uniref:DUF4382 domain-containing protein n=1 Tax=Salegentibacter salinarum TaxID=447422 RepID=A0A2N0TPQ4_9FLAO|nr:hypothetical protein [Salegentibacter salinarum]PKD16719.1 hypothetical protein APR41_07890 [Salegentibacter salinarum]SKB60329.1 hypothetical protein SAMN05660903_01615 [Salegentibacter salinarum]
MKNFKIYLAYVALLAMVMTSCSKEDNPDSPDGPAGDEMATLGFTALLEDFDRAMATKQANPGNEGEDAIPACSDEQPAMVRVALQDSDGNWVLDRDGEEDFIEIPVVPGEEGDTNWITDEGSNDELELLAGTYSLEYFDVVDSDGNPIYIAPRENDDYGPAEYQNFVSDALPIENIVLQNGVKKYIDVEVLCYDEHYVQEYGYLFFDFTEVDIVYLCLFGNYCDEDGRHTPAEFQFSVWNYTENTIPDTSDDNLLYRDVNETGVYENGDAYARPLCVALPARGEEDENVYYGELSMQNEEGEWEVIRLGAFSQDDVETLDLSEVPEGYDSGSNYYHFREGECGNQDDSDPCLFSEYVTVENDFESGDFINSISFEDDTDYDIFDPNNPYGSYLITETPSDLYGPFTSHADDDGMMLVLDGSPEGYADRAYYTVRTPELCAGATYFVTMRLRDLSQPDVNNARLSINYQSEDDPNGVVLTQFTITDLDGGSDPQGWKEVGFIMEAKADGQMIMRVRDVEDANSGNDFAMDDITLSNDPAILGGLSADNINPAN